MRDTYVCGLLNWNTRVATWRINMYWFVNPEWTRETKPVEPRLCSHNPCGWGSHECTWNPRVWVREALCTWNARELVRGNEHEWRLWRGLFRLLVPPSSRPCKTTSSFRRGCSNFLTRRSTPTGRTLATGWARTAIPQGPRSAFWRTRTYKQS